MRKTVLVLIPLTVLAVLAAPFGMRIRKDIHKKLNFKNTFAIQNVQSGKVLRPLDAQAADNTQLILYDHHNWECVTWQFIKLESDTYLLKNLFTEKTFQPASAQATDRLSQQELGGTPLQYWELVEQAESTFKIRLRGTDLYLIAPSAETNSGAALQPRLDSPTQSWRLLKQTPWI
jgi:hypothetical protein